jgi:hypothetical protein
MSFEDQLASKNNPYLRGSDPYTHNLCQRIYDKLERRDNYVMIYGISSSGPTRKVAPRALAISILSTIRS